MQAEPRECVQDAEERLAALIRVEVDIIRKCAVNILFNLIRGKIVRVALDREDALVAIHVLLIRLPNARDTHPNLFSIRKHEKKSTNQDIIINIKSADRLLHVSSSQNGGQKNDFNEKTNAGCKSTKNINW